MTTYDAWDSVLAQCRSLIYKYFPLLATPTGDGYHPGRRKGPPFFYLQTEATQLQAARHSCASVNSEIEKEYQRDSISTIKVVKGQHRRPYTLTHT